ncbi:MAG TPA: PEP/pyruvate-binding domain-containing protein [Nitrospira sp.]|nr:PEP/pyruvate-binding domain-containing protein [Nitrospira sp.]
MSPPFILPLSACEDPRLVGGKALGLGRLLRAGFPVPDGLCITTEAYRRHLETQGLVSQAQWASVMSAGEPEQRAVLEQCRSLILKLDISALADECREHMSRWGAASDTWAVRSSGSQEDREGASFAGLYRTHLAVPGASLDHAITQLWASVWEEQVVRYLLQKGRANEVPAMAIVIQPMVAARAAGVAYSCHPVTARRDQVMLNAVPGLGAPLVAGSASPDEFVIEMKEAGEPVRIASRMLGGKVEQLVLRRDGLRMEPVGESERSAPVLSDHEAFALARLVKQVERSLGCPVDVEWAIDDAQVWLLQGRPISVVRTSEGLTDDRCEWSRANFKETLPEVPSPLGLSFLRHFMDAYIVEHYRRLGCRIPEGLSAVRTLDGRPYLNVTLFHSLVGQLGGDPSLNAEQMGGEPLQSAPSFQKLGALALIRAGWLMWRELRRVERRGPRWFAEMQQRASHYGTAIVRDWPLAELDRHLEELARWLDGHEVTFGIAAGVGQCLQTFSALLPRWLGDDWRRLMNQALQGQGTVISAQQIVRLAELTQVARQDAVVSRGLELGWDLASLRRHAGSTAFLASFARYLDDYGHRGIGESDIMSPRFSDQPDALLDVIRVQLRAPASEPADILARQRSTRTTALAAIRSRLRRRWDRWILFNWWYRRLCRFFSLREANRHHLMYYSAAVRNLLLSFGRRLVERGTLQSPDDVFFVTLEERAALRSDRERDWSALVKARRAERDRWLTLTVPDTIRRWGEAAGTNLTSQADHEEDGLRGIPISAGEATGPVRLIRFSADWSNVQPGDIIVAPVIDPGMAPLFGIAAGLVVEMGGTLSHGAIIAREYGLPAVANVLKATTLLRDGETVTVDAGSGIIRRGSASGY